ncbi:MAG TPA: ABC transporter ATP-binding protein [Chitinophagaceae bacterium]|nr:ABC transporter ATP-binding protein [Chitinophagaceae bacterium]
MRLLLSYLRPYKWLVLLSLLLGVVHQVFSLLDPHFLGVIIDKFATHPRHTGYYNDKQEFVIEATRSRQEFFFGILTYLSLIVGVTIISRIAKVFQDYVINVIVQRLGAKIYTDGLKHTMQQSYEQFENQRSGETLNIIQKVKGDSERFITTFIYIVFAASVAFTFLIIYSFTLHWSIMPIYFAGIVVIAVISKILTRKIKGIQKTIVDEASSLAGTTTESLRNIELIKSVGLTEQEMTRLNNNTNSILSLELKKVKRIRLFNFIQGASVNFFRQVLLFTLLWLIFQNELTAGKLITLSFFSFYIFDPLYDVGKIIIFYREAQASLNKLSEILQKVPEQKPEKAVPVSSIEEIIFSGVVFKHQSSNYYALDNISFSAKKGDTIAFVGPSGAGKTTLVKLLTGLYKPQKGEILYNGVNRSEIDFESIRSQIGFVGQDNQLFAGTIKENLLFVHPTATDGEITEVLLKAACQNLLKRANHGINTIIGEGGIKISGGEKQRLSIARALIRHPRLLLFDEATSSLDSLTEEEITATIRSISAQRQLITILIAHRLSTVMHADIIYVLEKGCVVETGSHEDLVNRKGLYYAMWRQQIGERRSQAVIS